MRNARAQIGLVVAGIILINLFLFGESLLGDKLLMPLELLRQGSVWMSDDAADNAHSQYWTTSDQIYVNEPFRRFAVAELRNWRLPLWNPYIFCGVPFSVIHMVMSPFMILYYIANSPASLAWIYLLRSLVAGIGVYFFLKRVFELKPWVCIWGALCYPLTGSFFLWQGAWTAESCVWMPWLFVVVNEIARGKRGLWLSGLTFLVVVSGHPEAAMYILLFSGFYFLWCLYCARKDGAVSTADLPVRALRAGMGWGLGLAMSLPWILTGVLYARTGYRVSQRLDGVTDSVFNGLASLPALVMPFINGSETKMGLYVSNGNIYESAAMAYAGMLCLMVLVPLAFSSKKYRRDSFFWAALAFLGLLYFLDIPILKEIFRIPPLVYVRANRMAFITSWSILIMGALGLNCLSDSKLSFKLWWLIPLIFLGLICSWSLFRVFTLPHGYETHMKPYVSASFRNMYLSGFVVSLISIVSWMVISVKPELAKRLAPITAVLIIAELLYNATGFHPQASRDMYYPDVPVIEFLKKAPAGRVCEVGCFPSNLNMMNGIQSIRGYDAIDPKSIVEILEIANPDWTKSPGHAVTQSFVPRPSPLLNMLNMRYMLVRGRLPVAYTPPERTRLVYFDDEFFVLENMSVLSRTFVPEGVEHIEESSEVLHLLGLRSYDPLKTAYTEDMAGLPKSGIRGVAKIVSETPCDVVIEAEMETSGLVVLSDLWYPGWKCCVNGELVPVLKTNHALKGIKVMAGKSLITLKYQPESFHKGIYAMWAALFICFLWAAWELKGRRTH